MLSYCVECGRPLRHPASVKRGIGPVCLSKVNQKAAGNAGENQTPSIASLEFDGSIVCKRDEEGQAKFNISQRVIRHSPTGMEWGYGGSGPADFALNILLMFAPKHKAEELYQKFKGEFIVNIPKKGGVIEGSKIIEWLVKHNVKIKNQREDSVI